MLTTLVDCCLTVICNNIGRYKSFGDLSPKIAHVLYTWLKREKALDAHVFSLFFDCPFTALDLAKTNEDWVKVMASDSEHTRMKESLTLLDISHNPSLTDQGLQTLCALFPKLTHLILEGCKQVTGTAFADARPFKTVQYLNVGNTSVLGENITKLASLPALVKLDLTNCIEFKNDHLEHLAKHLSNLTELVLSNCDQIDGDGLSTLTHLPALRVLKLRYCVNINAGTKDPFVEWASTPLSQKLQALNLSGSATPVVTYQPPVTHLDLAFCQLSEERLASLGKLSGLQALDLVSAHNLNATSFPLLFGESGERLPELEMLNLSMCNQIRDTELLHLKGLTKLKSLNLSSCNLITSAGVLKLKQHLPSVVFDVRGCRGVNASEVMDSPTKNPLVTTNPLVYDTVHQRRRQPNVLVVEDGAMPAMILKMVFERHNYQVDIAENGVIGLELFTNSDKYDLVVMDIFMPKMDGIACTKMIRDYERKHAKRPTPIIIQTADTREAYKQLCLDAGCNGFVNKPFPKDLIVMAQSLLA